VRRSRASALGKPKSSSVFGRPADPFRMEMVSRTQRRSDAEVLSEVSTRIDLKGVHIPSAQARALKAKLSARDALVGCKVALVNNCRGILRGQRIRIKATTAKSFVTAVRAKFAGRGLATPVELERSLTCMSVLDPVATSYWSYHGDAIAHQCWLASP